MPAGSFQLVSLYVDSVSAVLVAPICSRLSATLQKLYFSADCRTEMFTEEQDEALRLLTSLRILWFRNCRALQSLPQGLHRLPSLQELSIGGTHKISATARHSSLQSRDLWGMPEIKGNEARYICPCLHSSSAKLSLSFCVPFIPRSNLRCTSICRLVPN